MRSGLNIAVALCAAIPAVAAAQKSPDRIRVTPQMRDGVVMVRVPDSPVSYMMVLQRVGSTGFGSRVYHLTAEPGRGATYLARTLKPGRYRFSSLVQQRHWGLGFGARTTEFEVVAGRVSFLGELNAAPLLASLQRQVVAAGKTELKGLGAVTTGFGATDETSDQFVGRTPGDLVDGSAFASRTMSAAGDATMLAPLLPFTPQP